MYLRSALKLAIPLAIRDRKDIADAYGHEGAEADAAYTACMELRALRGVAPSLFTPKQRETARMALLWGEQHLQDIMNATADIDKAEFTLAEKQYQQIRRLRVEKFGRTELEVVMQHCVEVPVGGRHTEKLFSMLSHVVCPVCFTRTNGASAGDQCRSCKTGIFELAPKSCDPIPHMV